MIVFAYCNLSVVGFCRVYTLAQLLRQMNRVIVIMKRQLHIDWQG